MPFQFFNTRNELVALSKENKKDASDLLIKSVNDEIQLPQELLTTQEEIILLVDDTQSIRMTTLHFLLDDTNKNILAGNPIVVSVENGINAIRVIEKLNGSKKVLVFMDYEMPKETVKGESKPASGVVATQGIREFENKNGENPDFNRAFIVTHTTVKGNIRTPENGFEKLVESEKEQSNPDALCFEGSQCNLPKPSNKATINNVLQAYKVYLGADNKNLKRTGSVSTDLSELHIDSTPEINKEEAQLPKIDDKKLNVKELEIPVDHHTDQNQTTISTPPTSLTHPKKDSPQLQIPSLGLLFKKEATPQLKKRSSSHQFFKSSDDLDELEIKEADSPKRHKPDLESRDTNHSPKSP